MRPVKSKTLRLNVQQQSFLILMLIDRHVLSMVNHTNIKLEQENTFYINLPHKSKHGIPHDRASQVVNIDYPWLESV